MNANEPPADPEGASPTVPQASTPESRGTDDANPVADVTQTTPTAPLTQEGQPVPAPALPVAQPVPAPGVPAAQPVPLWAIPASAGTPLTAAEGVTAPVAAPIPAAPAGPAGEPTRTAVPLIRRPLVLALGGVGAAVILVGAGFLAGLSVHRSDTTSLISGSGGALSNQAPGNGRGYPFGGGGGGFPGGGDDGRGSASGLAVVGRITAVSGSTLTVSSRRGTTVRVTTTSATTVDGTAGGSLSALKVGEFVLVTGTESSDGSIAATSIRTAQTRLGTGGGGQQGPGGQTNTTGLAGGVGGDSVGSA
jgi:Domain of unknown function (DUF5666)